MRNVTGIAAFLLVLAAWPATAQPAPDQQVCLTAAALLRDSVADLGKTGVRGLAPRAPALDQAVAEGKACFPSLRQADGLTVLTDGPAEALMAMVTAAVAKKRDAASEPVKAQENPFPRIALLLGSYYNEIGKPEDALRTLDAGLLLSPFPQIKLGRTVPSLIAERGAALNSLRKFDDALADYQSGLDMAKLANADRARFYRGRGYAFTEMGKLDEAEAAYQEALKLVPDDTRSQHELLYIAKVRSGKPASQGYMSTVAPAAADQEVPQAAKALPPVLPGQPPTQP